MLLKKYSHGGVHRGGNGDPESTADPRRAPSTAYGQGNFDPNSNRLIAELIRRTQSGEFDGQLPSGRVETADPLFDLLSLGSGQLGVRAIKKGVGEAGEAMAKQSTKGLDKLAKQYKASRVNDALMDYPDMLEEGLRMSEFAKKFPKGSARYNEVMAESERFMSIAKEQEQMLGGYGISFDDILKRRDLAKEYAPRARKYLEDAVSSDFQDYISRQSR